MGPQEDYIETVVTCEGDFHDPQLPRRLECFRQQLKDLLLADTHKPLILKKVEPWNSVRVTFNIPREAALRLKQLAEQGSASLRRLGVLAVQIDGDRLVSLTLATPNNQHAELIIRTHDASAQATTAGPSQASATVGAAAFDTGLPSSSDELGSPGPSSMEVTRKNIEEYLRQGSLFNSILAPSTGAGPGAGVVNNVGRQGKKVTASSPLLVNLLQTEPLAGGAGLNSKNLDPNEPPKPRKRRRKKKDKQRPDSFTGGDN
nr:hypothetical protein BaRGS_008838 [Batillaria attramentaria]